jgi:hypothetical protein
MLLTILKANYNDKERNRKVYRAADCLDRNSHPYRPRHHVVYGHLSEKVPRTFEVLGIFRIFKERLA